MANDKEKKALEAATKQEQSNAKSRKAVNQSFWSLVRHQFKKNKISLVALYVVFFLFTIAILADFLANDKPIMAKYNETLYFPVFKDYLVGLGLDRWGPDLVTADWRELEKDGKLSSTIWAPVRWRSSNQDLHLRAESTYLAQMLLEETCSRV
ncbi:MAG: hypothetical protein ABI778_09170 [Ignavibacteriota bacterium]